MKCPNCGAEVVGEACEYCGSRFQAPAPEKAPEAAPPAARCPRCSSDRVAFSVLRDHKTGRLSTSGACQNCGHCWSEESAPKKKNTWLWVLGWIFMFPLPLTILLLRKKDMNPAVKYGIIAIAWIIYLLIGLFGDSTQSQPVSQLTQSIFRLL